MCTVTDVVPLFLPSPCLTPHPRDSLVWKMFSEEVPRLPQAPTSHSSGKNLFLHTKTIQALSGAQTLGSILVLSELLSLYGNPNPRPSSSSLKHPCHTPHLLKKGGAGSVFLVERGAFLNYPLNSEHFEHM